ncbi:MAG TPA: hypothetical protein VFJ12_12955 [Segeticoccus sp.]|nr:hypothetical protein [Segeticoccus sp.]
MFGTTTSSVERVPDAGTDVAVADPAVESAVEEEFWAMVCDDAELLAAEFEAIIAAAWPGSPIRIAGRRADRHRWGAPVPVRVGASPPADRSARPGVDGWCRQRSPPHAE